MPPRQKFKGDKLNKPKFKAIVSALVGFIFIMGFLHLMNGHIKGPKKSKDSVVQFDVKKTKRKARQKLQKKKKIKKKKTSKAKQLKPRLDLAFASGGLDLGVDILGLSAKDSQLLSQASDSAMTEDIVDRLPTIQHREPIPYPDSAKDKNINGYVTVNILVNQRGRVEKVKLVEANPEGIFEQYALSGVKSWSFSPAQYQGRDVAVWVKQKIRFQVN